MPLFHGTTARNAERIIAGGFRRGRRHAAYRTIPQLTAGYYNAYESTLRRHHAMLEAAGEELDDDAFDDNWWLPVSEEALTAMPGAVYAFRSFEPALSFAKHRAIVHKDDRLCVFELRGRGAIPDEDWLGCVVLGMMLDWGFCPSEPDTPPPWGDPEFDTWARRVRRLLPAGWWRRAGESLDKLGQIEDPGQAVVATVGKAAIARLRRSRTGRRWLTHGARWSSVVAILGPVQPVRVACWDADRMPRRGGIPLQEWRKLYAAWSARQRDVTAETFEAQARSVGRL